MPLQNAGDVNVAWGDAFQDEAYIKLAKLETLEKDVKKAIGIPLKFSRGDQNGLKIAEKHLRVSGEKNVDVLQQDVCIT